MEVTVSPLVYGKHPMKPIKPSTTQQIQQKRLSIIISIMSHNKRPKPMLLTQLRKPRIPQLTRRHLNAYTLLPGKSLSLKPLDKDLHPEFPRTRLDKFLIPVTLRTTQRKIAMSNSKLLNRNYLREQIQHTHRIHSPAHSQQKTHRSPLMLTGMTKRG